MMEFENLPLAASPTDAKTSGEECKEQQDIYRVPKYVLIRYLLIMKGYRVTLQWRNLGRTTLISWQSEHCQQ